MLINFYAFIICIIAAIYHGVNGNIGWFLIECGLALANLPYAIEEIKEFIKNNK